jgi:hypothetical protein
MEPRIDAKPNSPSLCSLAGQYDNPISTRCLAPIDFLKIPAQATWAGGIHFLESIPGLHKLKNLKNTGSVGNPSFIR